jgi:pilus assembly protein Flp/PilA
MGMRNERGASAVEYGLLVAGVALALVLVALTFGATLTSVFAETNSRQLGCPTCSTP